MIWIELEACPAECSNQPPTSPAICLAKETGFKSGESFRKHNLKFKLKFIEKYKSRNFVLFLYVGRVLWNSDRMSSFGYLMWKNRNWLTGKLSG